jgi:hypothetical protein
MMPEGNETPGGEPPATREGLTPFARGDADLLAERRARRAAEGGEAAVTRRAEAAEATVQTLELHVSSLQQRLADAQAEHASLAELLEVERASALAGEDELRRVKQREYAEQQLRVEAEERLAELDRSARAEEQLIARRMAAGERHAQELSERLDALQRQLAEAEHTAAAERAALTHAETDLRVRVEELERSSEEMRRSLEAERAARERADGLLESMRQGHARMEPLLADIGALIRRLAAALGGRAEAPRERTAAAPAPPAPTAPTAPPTPARFGAQEPSGAPASAGEIASGGEGGAEMADALAAAVVRLRARAESAEAPELAPAETAQAPAPRPTHRHSHSAISRWRKRRKQRHGAPDGRRGAS